MTAEMTLAGALSEAMTSTLETMCFLSAVGEGTRVGAESLSAEVLFDGDATGHVLVSMTTDAALAAASGFLGLEEEEVTREAAIAVLLELANMICGRMLSTYESEGDFRLRPPRVVELVASESQAQRSLALDVGAITCAAKYARVEQPVR